MKYNQRWPTVITMRLIESIIYNATTKFEENIWNRYTDVRMSLYTD